MPYADPGVKRDYHRSYMRDYTLRRKYGMSAEECEALLFRQGGVCAICRADKPDDKPNGRRFKKNWCVDHCHATGVVRGLLCNHCNLAIGYARDNPETLISAAEYLRAHSNKVH